MNIYQRIALNTFLSDWPQDCDYIDILNLLDKNSNEILVWEPFENYPGNYVSEQIECLKDTLEFNFKEKIK